jgi:radical SAM/Cys-rich protein
MTFDIRTKIKKEQLNIIQINVGDRCNQTCTHCHIGASPSGKKNMDYITAKKVMERLLSLDVRQIEFTGGTPEVNPNLAMFIEGLSGHKAISVRTSLTVLDDPEFAYFADLYRKHKVKVIASLPGLSADVTDRQRGKNVFCTSVKVLRELNTLGYGTNGLSLDLVYNPPGDCLPPEQGSLEKEYKQFLKERHGILFDNLVTIVNSPINRFTNYLDSQKKLDKYWQLLEDKHNPETLKSIMCRHLISINYQGFVFDCDFNLALEMRIKGLEDKRFWEIDFASFSPEITLGRHCYACTVNKGSSCHGVLIKDTCGTVVSGENNKCTIVRSSFCK